ncbi:MAG: serine/threonine-protein kinase [Planctomycetota bacterium]
MTTEDAASSDHDRHPVEVLAEEFAERLRRGEPAHLEDYCARYPELAPEIRELFPLLVAMERVKSDTAAAASDLPQELPFDHIGEYRLLREIGRGGMGIVFEAVQETLDRRVALKILPGQALLSPRRRERFLREARATARLHHTNIVPVFDVGVEGDYSYYVMQFIDGRGLDAVVRELVRAPNAAPLTGTPAPRFGPEYWRKVATIGQQIAEALAYAHDHGTLHRDIKPSNVLLDTSGTAWIADFGLAKVALGADSASSGIASHEDLTLSGDVLGTLRYMAPEQRDGRPAPASDIYGLGLTLYELLTLEPAFGSTRELLLGSERAAPAPGRVNPQVPRDLDTIVATACASRAEDRYSSARALAEDLLRFLEERPILAHPTGRGERLWRWCRRNPALATTSAAAVSALLLAAIIGWVGYASTQDAFVKESAARREADENVHESLAAFEKIFEALAPTHGWNAPESRRRAGGGPNLHLGPRDPVRRRRTNEPVEGAPTRSGANPIVPREEEARASRDAEVMGAILAFYDSFAARNATSPRLQEEAAHAYRRVAAIHERLAQTTEARVARARAIELFAGLVAKHPEQASYVEGWYASKVESARFGDESLDPLRLIELRQELAQARRSLDRATGDRLRELEAQVLVDCGQRYAIADDETAASGCFEEAQHLLASAGPDAGVRPAMRIEVAIDYARTLSDLGQPARALEVVLAARRDLRGIVPPPPSGLAAELDRVEIDALESLDRFDEAAEIRRRRRAHPPRPGDTPR